MDSLKTWLVEVALKKLGPTAMAAGISALFALLAAHQGLLEQWGITFGTWPLQWTGDPPSGHVILIELDTVSTAALALMAALVTAAMAAAQHHTAAAVTGAPQSGDMRTDATAAIAGGNRKGDPQP